MQKKVAIKLHQVQKHFNLPTYRYHTLRDRILNSFRPNPSRKIQVLKPLNLEIYQGECVGIVGRNGCGKSTLLKIMSRVYMPDKKGKITLHGSHILLNLGIGFAPQMTGRENLYINASILGLKRAEIKEIEQQIIEFSELGDFIHQKIKYYSSGMVQRLAFSIALHIRADILFLDEVFAVGDAKFVQKAIRAIEDNFIGKKTVILVSHAQEHIQKYCNRVLVLNKGELLFDGDPIKAYEIYNQLE